jgi:uncharacterized protein
MGSTGSSKAATLPLEDLRPVSTAERVALIDVLRGFALYGVLLANTIPFYSGRSFLPKAEVAARTSSLDQIALVVINVFVDGKAMTLLSFLFGLGFAVQLTRAESRGRSVLPVYLRRLVVMIAIGGCHITFIWWGDILASYAVTGFLLILFRRRTDRALLVWAALLIFVPHLVTTLPSVADLLKRVIHNTREDQAFKDQVFAALAGNDSGQRIRMQVSQYLHHLAPVALTYFPWTLGRFLLGYCVGRSRLLQDPLAHVAAFRKLLGWALGLGLAGSIAMAVQRTVMRQGGVIPPWLKVALVVPDDIGTLGMAASYVSILALLMGRPAWQRRLSFLAPVGQMALTTYLSQSVVSTFLFYGWGLGLIGRVGPALCIPLTLAIFSAQILASRWWLQRFRFGPVEWLWRSLAYGKPQPMRRAELRPAGAPAA